VVFARPIVLVATLALAAALVAGCGEKDEPDLTAAATETEAPTTTTAPAGPAAEVAGDWTGQLTQKGLKPFQVAVRIDPSGNGQVAYTGIRCGGSWGLGPVQESAPPTYNFRETIRRGAGGKCKGTGNVQIVPAADGTLGYNFTGGGVTSRGTLTRTDAAGLAPVFKRAGVTPPA
jgi:hypothetical protein